MPMGQQTEQRAVLQTVFQTAEKTVMPMVLPMGQQTEQRTVPQTVPQTEQRTVL
jgi:hypothetical protein